MASAVSLADGAAKRGVGLNRCDDELTCLRRVEGGNCDLFCDRVDEGGRNRWGEGVYVVSICVRVGRDSNTTGGAIGSEL
jgi:hypothetical protein